MPDEDTAALPIYAMPGHVIRRLQQVAVSLFVEEMEGAGIELTAVQFAALVAIDAYPLIDQSTLGKIIAYDRTTIGGVIDRLEDRGLVRRVVTRENKRIRQLIIEPSGQELLGRSRPVAERVQERLLDPLTGPERDAFMTLSGKILDAYNDLSRAPLRPMNRR
jgi:DNA-binding MarR family transcriptional regulator